MVKDLKYVIKRILIGVGIALLLSFLRGNLFIMAHALTSHTDSIELCATNLGCNTQSYAPVTQSYANSGTVIFTNVSLQQGHTYSMNFYMTLTTPSFSFASGAPRMYVNPGGIRAYPDRNENLFVNRTGNNTYSITWSFDLDNTGGTFSTASISYEFSSNYNGTLYSTTVNSVSLDYTDITGGTGSSNDDIINNATSNTQNIINNANNNSQSIINNQNNNTQEIKDTIDSALGDDCINAQTVHPTFTGVALARAGSNFEYYVNDSNSGGVYDVSAYVGKEITVSFSGLGNHTPRTNYCVGPTSATSSHVRCLVGSVITSSSTSGSYTFTVPENGKYLYVVGYNNYTDTSWVNKVSISLPKVCRSKIDKTTDAINDMNDTLKDDSSVSNSDINNLFDDIDTGESNSPVSDLLTMPLTLINAYIIGMSSSCSSINLGSLYGTNLVMPCINLQSYLGSNLWSLIDALFSIFMIYNVGMLCVSIYESITSLDDSMQLLYSPQHANSRVAQRGGTYNG